MSSTPQHRHWDTFDYDECEGARMDALHALVSTAPYDADAAALVVDELVDMARSKGWGEEDSWLCSVGAQPPEQDDDDQAALREQHGDDPDSEYTECLDRSLRLMLGAAASSEAREGVGDLLAAMTDAREAGRTARREQAPQTAPGPRI